jgi:hypothetical protein
LHGNTWLVRMHFMLASDGDSAKIPRTSAHNSICRHGVIVCPAGTT